jgi:DNA-binding MltR family transcriptional regulator
MTERKPSIRNTDFIRRTTAASAITAEFLQESDRGCILIGGAMLDELMRAMLQAYFIEEKKVVARLLDGGDAPLGTFSSRIALCRALGLIPEELHHDLEIVRKIRNDAAHFEWSREDAFDISFTNKAVRSRMLCLRCVHSGAWEAGLSPRQIFVALVAGVCARFSELSLAGLFVRENMDQEVGKGFGTTTARRMLVELGSREFRPVVSRTIHELHGVYLEPPPTA